ncbi:MAG: N-acetylmuramoyl-L-alanine amidase [Smithella sp.]|jgi:N-acetylmuramoyl-L-alanine amidase|nr:N-acetylmuramoyl-L-alanine amidase [Smithella sp.]
MLEKYRVYTFAVFCLFVLSIVFAPLCAQAGHAVMIDPAHGGADTGVTAGKTVEKDLTLAIALELKKALAADGAIEAVLTRDVDKTVSIQERREKILKRNPALVLSLHVNAGFGKSSSGFELYYPGFVQQSALSKKTGKVASKEDKKHLNDTIKLARIVQRNLDNLFARKGRGLREAPVPLAEGLAVPVLIVELGFITNADDRKKLESAKTQKEIAGALAAAIRSFF